CSLPRAGSFFRAIEPSRVASLSAYYCPYLSFAILVGQAQLGGQHYWDRATDPHLAPSVDIGASPEGPAGSSAAQEFMQRDEPLAEETGLRFLTPFQEGRRVTVIRLLYPERSWTTDERTAPKIKSQQAVCIPRDADPDALPDFAGFVITTSEP